MTTATWSVAGRPRWTGAALAVLTLVVCLLGALSHNIYALGIPIALGIVLVCATGALRQFPVFIMALLMMRPLLDATKTSSATGLFEPTTIVSVALLIVAPLWLVAQRRVSRAPLTPLTVGMLAMVGSFAVSTVSSLVPLTSVVATLKTAAWVLMFLVVRRMIDSEKRLRQLVIALALSAVIPALLAIYESATPGAGYFSEVKSGVTRVRSTFDQSNDYARYLMLIILLAVALMPVLSKRSRRLAVGGALISTALIGTTYTRSAWFGLAIGIIVIAVMQRRKLIIAGMLLGFVVVLALPQTSSHITELASSGSSSHATDDSVTWRFAYWKDVWSLAKINPVTGIGPAATTSQTTQAKEPHNEYLRAVTEGGVIGGIAYLVFLGTAIAAGRRAARAPTSSYGRAMGVGFTAVAIAVMFASVASNVVLEVSFMWYFAAFAAVADRLSWATFAVPQRPSGTSHELDDLSEASPTSETRSLAWT
jgi:O-antigen ligase